MRRVDLDALRRAVEWGKRYQKSEPQITVLPSPLPPEGTPQWVEVATRVAVMAQAATLGIKPWEAEPVNTHDDGCADPNCYGRRPAEITLRRRMVALKISIYEPDVPATIARAEAERVKDHPQEKPRARRGQGLQ
jgi:hypothetical protein